MKILIINKFLHANGGSETYIFDIGKELVRKGHQVEYFGMDHPNRVVGNSQGVYTSNMDFHSGKLSKLLYPFKIIYSTESYRKVLQLLEVFEPDIVHINNFNFQLTPSIIYAISHFKKKSGKNTRIILTAHDYQWVCPNHMMMIPYNRELCFACKGGRFFHCMKNRCIHQSMIKSLLGTAESYIYRILRTYAKADVIICPSEFLRQQLSTNPILRDKTITLHNFVEPLKQEKINVKKENYVLYFGRYSEEKGMGMLLSVCRALPEIPFIFAGSGSFKEQIAEIKNITDRGFLKGDELRELIQKARFVLFPSQWNENCPFSVMETQVYGTPILASSLGGTPELIKNKITGELIDNQTPEVWIDAIRSLWQDEVRCKVYTENCRKVKFLTSEEYVTILVGLYQGEKENKINR